MFAVASEFQFHDQVIVDVLIRAEKILQLIRICRNYCVVFHFMGRSSVAAGSCIQISS